MAELLVVLLAVLAWVGVESIAFADVADLAAVAVAAGTSLFAPAVAS